MKTHEKGNSTAGVLVGLVIGAWILSAWITHLVVCFQTEKWGFLVAGAVFFPIGIVHGTGIWFHWW